MARILRLGEEAENTEKTDAHRLPPDHAAKNISAVNAVVTTPRQKHGGRRRGRRALAGKNCASDGLMHHLGLLLSCLPLMSGWMWCRACFVSSCFLVGHLLCLHVSASRRSLRGVLCIPMGIPLEGSLRNIWRRVPLGGRKNEILRRLCRTL